MRGNLDGDTVTVCADGLSKRYADVQAVSDVSFVASPGRVAVLAGANGSGKTTTLRMLVGLVRPTAGHATFNGLRYDQLDVPQRTVGAVMDVEALDPGRRTRDHLRVAAATVGADDDTVDGLLEQVDLTDAARRPVAALSLGMRQRLSIAAAMVGDPKVLVLDEPANGLDPAGLRWLRRTLRSAADAGRTVVVSTHQLRDVDEVADDVMLVRDGTIARTTTVAALREHGPVCRVETSDPDAVTRTLRAADLRVLDSERDGTLRVAASPDTVRAVTTAADVPVAAVHQDRRSVEDAYFELIDDPGPDPG